MKTVADIAATLQGHDPQALPVPEVNAFLAQLVSPIEETEQVGIFDALDRVLAADLVSPLNVPPHDNSAMDGYAFDGAALADAAPLALRVVGTAFAGTTWRGQAGPGDCVKVMTGAVMPAGLDTVVPLELVRLAGDQVQIPADALRRGDNRRLAGEDIRAGTVALARGSRLTPAALGLAASLGIAQLTVVRRLRVAYFSTGDEILSLGEPPREGAVYDSNRYTVFGLLRRMGITVLDLGVVPDQPAQLEAAFTQAAAQADAIITSGGVSMGDADYTQAMMHKLAGDVGGVAFWRIAMRPGRPMAVGRIARPPLAAPENPDFITKSATGQRESSADSYQKESAILFGLPGNPVAVMVTFLAFVRPALLQMMGNTTTAPPLLRARSLEPLPKKPGRTEYQRGTVSTAADGTLQVRTTGNQGSGVLSSMVQGNGLIVLHHGQGNVAVGDEVDVMVFDGVI